MRDVTTATVDFNPVLAFLLTRPMRDVTLLIGMIFSYSFVSTHTPHAGRDAARIL